MLPLINSRTNLSEFANQKMEQERRKQRKQMKSRLKLRYGSPTFLESDSISPIGEKQVKQPLFSSQIDLRKSVGQNFSSLQLNKLSGLHTPHQHRSSVDNIGRLTSPAARLLLSRDFSETRKGKQKVSFENFWDNIKDYRLPLTMQQVDVALQSKPEWNRNINRFTHTPVSKENNLRDMLKTLPCHYGDYSVRADMNQRDQALLMIGWLQRMKQATQQITHPTFLEQVVALKKIFLLFLKQLSRQLGISCNQRGISIDCAGIFVEEYFQMVQEFISTKEQMLEETMKIRERELNQILELKEAYFLKKMAIMEADQVKARMEDEKQLLEKDSTIKLLREKNKHCKARCKLYEDLIETSSKKYLKGLQELNYQQMHLLGLSLKNSKISRLFVNDNEAIKPNLKNETTITQNIAFQINDQDYRQAFRQMRDSVAVNASKQILSRAQRENRKMSGDHYSVLSEQDQREALKCIGEYPVGKLHQILLEYENKPLMQDQEAQYEEPQEQKQEVQELNQFEELMNQNEQRNLEPPDIFFEQEIKVTDHGEDNYPSMKSKMSLHSLLEDQREEQDKIIGATGMLVHYSKENSRATSRQSPYKSSNYLFAPSSYLQEISDEQHIPRIIKMIQESPIKEAILERISEQFKPMTYDMGVQTQELKEKKSSPVVIEEKK